MFKFLGPGILLAGAAIGGSHLVASTQAGAKYGWSLLGILFLINLFKYPFFLYSKRYTAATGENILQGYLRLGKRYLIMFFILNIFTGFINIAGVSMITGSLATNFGITGFSVPIISGFIMFICLLVIVLGGFSMLRSFGTTVVLVLGISTIIALAISIIKGPVAEPGFVGTTPWTMASFGFIIVFMGWMPAPIDVSVWPSLWMKSQEIVRQKATSMREAMIDFKTGYFGTVFFAFVFLILGKMVMYGSGTELSSQGSVFARQLIDMYSHTIGQWARPIIIIAAFSAMLSTSLTTIDGYPRTLAASTTILFRALRMSGKNLHNIWIIAAVGIGFLIINNFSDRLGDMLALAMIVSFLTAPVFAWLNYKIMFCDNVPDIFRPKPWLKALSVSGIIFLTGFSLIFLYWYFVLR
jgi:Mn2+/Fe2+ NRAMP family transporter